MLWFYIVHNHLLQGIATKYCFYMKPQGSVKSPLIKTKELLLRVIQIDSILQEIAKVFQKNSLAQLWSFNFFNNLAEHYFRDVKKMPHKHQSAA